MIDELPKLPLKSDNDFTIAVSNPYKNVLQPWRHSPLGIETMEQQENKLTFIDEAPFIPDVAKAMAVTPIIGDVAAKADTAVDKDGSVPPIIGPTGVGYTLLVDEEGKPISDSTPVTPKVSDREQAARDKAKLKANRKLAAERLLSTLGRTLKDCGFEPRLGGMVLAAVGAHGGKIDTDFAFNPVTKRGVVWGFTTGGAVSYPFAITQPLAVMGINLRTGQAVKPNFTKDMIHIGCQGYWLTYYELPVDPLEAAEQEVGQLALDKSAGTGIVKGFNAEPTAEDKTLRIELDENNDNPEQTVSELTQAFKEAHSPEAVAVVEAAGGFERGQTPHVQIVDELGVVPNNALDDACAVGKAALDEVYASQGATTPDL